MRDFFFISHSYEDGREFAIGLADELRAGSPSIPVWLDKLQMHPGDDWDEQLSEAIKTCKGMIFVMTSDSVRKDSHCKQEWVWALKYKKPIIPILLDQNADQPYGLGRRHYIAVSGGFDVAIAQLRKHLAWLDSPAGQLNALEHRRDDAERELPRADPLRQARILEEIAQLDQEIARQQAVVVQPERGNKTRRAMH